MSVSPLKTKLRPKALLLSVGLCLTFGLCAQADTLPITFIGAPTGVNNGVDYVLPYQLSINGVLTSAICYDIFDDVTPGQTWTANVLTVEQAAATGQFSSIPSALQAYKEIGFLSQQITSSPQNQIDLQQDIWNIFAPGTYTVSAGMQTYLNLLTTSAFTTFNFASVGFLEDVNQSTGRAQAFVIDPPIAGTAEPGTLILFAGGCVLLAAGLFKRNRHAA